MSQLPFDQPMSETARAPRIAAIDVLRGVAIVAMVIYHLSWDLLFYGWVDWAVEDGLGWRIFRTLIAGTFLALVGVSLVLAHRSGFNRRGFVRRLAMVAAGAVAVTIATYAVFPNAFVFFGILHAIALFSVLGLLFLRLVWWFCLACAVIVIALPFLVQASLFDWPPLLWVGLGTYFPRTMDYEPIFPWFGATLLGMAAAKLYLPDRLAGWRAGDRVSRSLRWAGRHSLPIYLIHQPVLIALVYAATLAFGAPQQSAGMAGFTQACQQNCRGGGFEQSFCTAYCSCLAGEAMAAGLTGEDLMAMEGPVLEQLENLAAVCRSMALEPPPSGPAGEGNGAEGGAEGGGEEGG
jgi:uncharacterized membrane protein